MWSGSASLFKVCAVTALLLMVYFALRVANQEFAPWRFKPVKRWVREKVCDRGDGRRPAWCFFRSYRSFNASLHAALDLGRSHRAHAATSITRTFLLLLFYALSYGVWGLVTLALWERRAESRQVFIRCLFFSLVIFSALFYLPLNPMAFLLAISEPTGAAAAGAIRHWMEGT